MKKYLLSLALIITLTLTNAYAFTYPTPDWGALLSEKQQMVSEADFELYTEADAGSAPYYGARLEPLGGTYIGTIAETSEQFQPLGGYLTYIQDMGQDDLYYPANSIIGNSESTAMVGWTVFDMATVDFNHVKSVLDTLDAYGKPMFLRFANEMNVSNLGDDPELYKNIFRQFAALVHENYKNFAVVWSPNDLGALDRPFEYFYPGDEYVDWIGVSCYSIKYFQGDPNADPKSKVYFMTGENAWATNRLMPIMDFMQKSGIKKPVMLSECGVATGNIYGENLQSWASPRLRNLFWNTIMKYPQIKMINYFNTRRSDEKEWFDISEYAYAADIFKEAEQCGAYLRSANAAPQFVFMPASSGKTLYANSGKINLYTLAHIPQAESLTVNYAIDGNWYHCSDTIPYKCTLDASSLADGEHTVRIWAYNYDKTYTFIKSGNAIRFGGIPDTSAENRPQSDKISVELNGKKLEFDTEPMLINDRTMVPMRKIFESLGAIVDWEEDTQTVTAKRGDKTIVMQIDSNIITVNNEPKILDTPAKLVGDRTLVPIRAISESLGASVDWIDATQTVVITDNN